MKIRALNTGDLSVERIACYRCGIGWCGVYNNAGSNHLTPLFFGLFPLSTAFGVAKSSSALSMAMPSVNKGVMAAVAGAMPAVLSSSAALATEGTNEWFGVDDLRLLGVLFIGHWFILTLWLQQYGDYDEAEDFFGEIDYGKK